MDAVIWYVLFFQVRLIVLNRMNRIVLEPDPLRNLKIFAKRDSHVTQSWQSRDFTRSHQVRQAATLSTHSLKGLKAGLVSKRLRAPYRIYSIKRRSLE